MLSIPIISEFDGKGIDRALREFKNLETVGQKAQFAIKKAAIPAAAAIGGIAIALTDATKAAIDDQKEQSQLKTILQNTTDATDLQVKAIEDQITFMSRASGIADTDYRIALETLTVATEDTEKAMDFMNIVMDTSVGLHTDSAGVADALAKAYDGNFKALKVLSPEIKQMVDDGADLDEIMGYMADTFGGSVAANAETAAGKLEIMKNSIGETKESIGAALLPVVEAVLPYLQKFADWANDNPDAFLFIAGAIGLVAGAIVATNIAMALNPFSLIAIGVGLLVAGLVIAYKKFEWFETGIKNVVNAIISVFEIWANSWIKVVNAIIKGYNALPLLPDIALIGEIKIGRIGGGGGEGSAGGGINVPKMAEGGIVNSATLAIIGEKGPEAVIPLSKMGQMGGGMSITVNAGLVSTPDQIGQDIIAAIQKAQRRSGMVFASA
jgi:hypothetical protein